MGRVIPFGRIAPAITTTVRSVVFHGSRSQTRGRFPRMTLGAKRLPVSELVPKQTGVALMRGDMVDDVRECRTPLVVTLRHDGRSTVGAHPAKREPGPEQPRASRPTIAVSARLTRAPSPIDVASVGGTTAAGDERVTTGFGAIHERHVRSGHGDAGRAVGSLIARVFVAPGRAPLDSRRIGTGI
jgi:hypothetical protein